MVQGSRARRAEQLITSAVAVKPSHCYCYLLWIICEFVYCGHWILILNVAFCRRRPIVLQLQQPRNLGMLLFFDQCGVLDCSISFSTHSCEDKCKHKTICLIQMFFLITAVASLMIATFWFLICSKFWVINWERWIWYLYHTKETIVLKLNNCFW
jgi:hypothetical protein